MKRPWIATIALLVSLITPIEGDIDAETLQCIPHVFVPFTFAGLTRTIVSRGTQSTGFSHMAAAFMALEHFNARNPSVVPELALFQDCNVTFKVAPDENGLGALFYDTGSMGHQASQLLYSVSQNEKTGSSVLPCAFVGPYHDSTALSIATMAASIGVPHIPSGGHDARLAEDLMNPYTSVIYPRLFDMLSALGRFLTIHQRTNYVVTLFGFTDSGNQFQEGVNIVLDAIHIYQRRNFGYLGEAAPQAIPGQSIREVMAKIQDTGYRTIIVIMDNDVCDLPSIANGAEEFQLNTNDYLWVFLPPFQPEAVDGLMNFPESLLAIVDPPLPHYGNVKKLLTGAALLHPVDGFQVHRQEDRLAQAWRSVDESFVERLNSQATVVNPNGIYQAKDYEQAHLEYFQTNLPEPGSSYIFDAVMAVGMGACLASGLSGQELLGGIRAVNFTGSSGHVEFGITAGFVGNLTGARQPADMTVGVFNLFPPGNRNGSDNNNNNKSCVLTATYTDLLDSHEIKAIKEGADLLAFVEATEYHPFIFRDGTTTAPNSLRNPADQNYLSPALAYLGLTMMGLALICCLSSAVWVYLHRKRRVVIASQPQFLYLLLLGAGLMSLSIFGISADESMGWTAEQLGRHCVATVWLASVGHILVYSALFTKLWRVNKVLQFSRRKIKASHVAWPAAFLMVAAITILTLWQTLDPLQWVRVELDEATGESIGQCDSETMVYYLVALSIVMGIPTVLTCVMAWKTRDVDDDYTETSWIFTLVVIQLQVIIVAIPLVTVLRSVSTDGKYIGLVVLLWSMPMSTILLIMLPKLVTFYQGQGGMSRSDRIRGSSGGAIRITGVLPSSSMAMADSARRTTSGGRFSDSNSRRARGAAAESDGEFAED